jgi:anthranilate synthase component 2
VLSPGPCTPNEAGICLDLVRQGAGQVPVFGVCLGLQTIGQAFGGAVVRAPEPMHGKVSQISHRSRGLFRGLNGPLAATRYHSLVVARDSCPAALEIEAETADGLIMALSHRELPVHGVQFHPESIASEHGATLLRNFLDLATDWSRRRQPALAPA